MLQIKQSQRIQIVAPESACPCMHNDGVCALDEHSLLLGVDKSPIPSPITTTINSGYNEILSMFNIFRNNAIGHLTTNSKLRTIEQALSFNRIILLNESSYEEYGFNYEVQKTGQ